MAFTTRMKGSLPCRCDRGERQRVEDDWAKLMGKAPRKIGHNPSCPIVLAARLKVVEAKLNRLSEQPALPDPVLQGIDAQAKHDLADERMRLRKSLARHIDTAVVSSP